jgi:site-specific DNA-methyltransferase (adenine-specific)
MELDRIYNEDCLEGMKRIPDGSVDCIICDLPYGTMNGISAETFVKANATCEWDDVIPTDQLFAAYDRVLRTNGTAVLFSQEPYTMHLRTYPKKSNLRFCYPMIWKKEKYGNALFAAKAPLSFFEDINVFTKPYDSNGTNNLRKYFAAVLEFIGKTKKDIMQIIGERADHVLRVESTQWALCTADTYSDIIRQFGIDKMDGFREYEDLQNEDIAFKEKYKRVFNLPEGQAYVSNILEYSKDKTGLHPTQKPVALISQLVRTYSNEGDTILDNCMGSGTTAIACIKEKRHFVGFELNKEYYDKAVKRIQAEQSQLTLF